MRRAARPLALAPGRADTEQMQAREHLPAGGTDKPVLDVVIPVYNEEKDLGECVRRLHAHLVRTFPYRFRSAGDAVP